MNNTMKIFRNFAAALAVMADVFTAGAASAGPETNISSELTVKGPVSQCTAMTWCPASRKTSRRSVGPNSRRSTRMEDTALPTRKISTLSRRIPKPTSHNLAATAPVACRSTTKFSDGALAISPVMNTETLCSSEPKNEPCPARRSFYRPARRPAWRRRMSARHHP